MEYEITESLKTIRRIAKIIAHFDQPPLCDLMTDADVFEARAPLAARLNAHNEYVARTLSEILELHGEVTVVFTTFSNDSSKTHSVTYTDKDMFSNIFKTYVDQHTSADEVHVTVS